MTSNTADPEKRRLPAFYALAMAVDAAVALLTGRAIDRYGAGVLVLPGLAGMTPLTAGEGTRGHSTTPFIWPEVSPYEQENNNIAIGSTGSFFYILYPLIQ